MAKLRHRLFEIYELHDEAVLEMTPRNAVRLLEKEPATATAKFSFLDVVEQSGVMVISFVGKKSFDESTTAALRDDLALLIAELPRDSKALFDFDGVESFCPAAVAALTFFNQKLRVTGSRMALCRLAPAVQKAFF